MDSTQAVAVLDTNAVLDWLVFRNPAAVELGAAIVDGRVVWLGTAPMRRELEFVLATGRLDRWTIDVVAPGVAWDRWCRQVDPPAPIAPSERLRCSDPDDQMFVELAFASRCRWLVTRDRALLKLASRLRARGVEVLIPERWQLE